MSSSIPLFVNGEGMRGGAVHHTIAESLYTKLTYSLTRDFVPITVLAYVPNVVVVHPKHADINSLKDLMAYAKANPGKVTMSSAGNGTPPHMAGELFKMMADIDIVHVPYRGGALAINDTIAGTVDAIFAVMPEAVQHVKAGTLYPLAVMTANRSSVFPQVPTMVESGVSDLVLPTWIALLAPAKTPKPIIDQLNRAVLAAFDADTERPGRKDMRVIQWTTGSQNPYDVEIRKGHDQRKQGCNRDDVAHHRQRHVPDALPPIGAVDRGGLERRPQRVVVELRGTDRRGALADGLRHGVGQLEAERALAQPRQLVLQHQPPVNKGELHLGMGI